MRRNTVKRDNGTLKCLFTFCKNFVHVYNVFWSNHSHFPLPQMPSLPLFLSNFKLFLKYASIPVSICLSVSLVLKTSASTYCCLLGIWVWNTFWRWVAIQDYIPEENSFLSFSSHQLSITSQQESELMHLPTHDTLLMGYSCTWYQSTMWSTRNLYILHVSHSQAYFKYLLIFL